jgi:hypothetical protein
MSAAVIAGIIILALVAVGMAYLIARADIDTDFF